MPVIVLVYIRDTYTLLFSGSLKLTRTLPILVIRICIAHVSVPCKPLLFGKLNSIYLIDCSGQHHSSVSRSYCPSLHRRHLVIIPVGLAMA